ncbi:uncharacterized protein F4812DRAFT_81627 [Daldinia caldariorum]|uniref:uncharacterized protein n=1 Tax=Daldinia caldariorum TaxID=326644 RepID=UPI0020072E9C|nr:uncharacterized protein F4812DRAFT_81627 [Daldinia caldariorum]KAI1466518.1 hypothetical protein F4812DRAFT_81627 [Daldinia caldariorum]
MGLSNQARTAVAAGLLAFSAQAAASANSPSSSSRYTATSTVSLAKPSSSAIPGVANVPMLLAVVPVGSTRRDTVIAGKNNRKNAKRGPAAYYQGFVGAPAANPLGCADATAFDLSDGVVHHGDAGAGRDVLYEPLAAVSSAVSEGAKYTPGRVVVEDGRLRWYDSEFYGGRARYCQMPGSGQVYVTFHVEDTWPEGCREVDLAAEPESSCRDGTLASGGGNLKGGDKAGKKHTHKKGRGGYESEDGYDSDGDHDVDDKHKHKDKGKGKNKGKGKDHDDKDKKHDDSDSDDSDHDSDSDDDDHHHYRTRYDTSTGYSTSYSQASPTSYQTNSGYKTSSSYSSSSSSSSPHSQASPAPPYPTTASAQTPSSEGIYLTNASPTGQECVETHLSWVQGSHTFIKDEL